MVTAGYYEMSFDFIAIEARDADGNKIPEPDCVVTTYARYMSTESDPWTPPPAPNGSTGWIIEYSLFAGQNPFQTGTGDVPEITINPSTPGYNPVNTGIGCPVHVVVTYTCANSPSIPEPTDTSEERFVFIAEDTTNPSQLTQLDMILIMLGKDPDGDYSGQWELIFAEAEAFLLANPDYILDFSNLEMTNMFLVNTLSELKKINVSHNLITGFDLASLTDVELTYIDASYNLIGGTDDTQLEPLLESGLVYIDLSHNQIQEYFLFSASNGGGNWVMDYVDISYNFMSVGNYAFMQTKVFKFTNNTFPTGTFWGLPDSADDNDQQQISWFGSNWQDIELIDLTNTQLRYSINYKNDLTPTPDDEVTNLLNAIIADGHTPAEAVSIVVRNPKWENEIHDPYDPDNILGDN